MSSLVTVMQIMGVIKHSSFNILLRKGLLFSRMTKISLGKTDKNQLMPSGLTGPNISIILSGVDTGHIIHKNIA
jgi:hypothetical protein